MKNKMNIRYLGFRSSMEGGRLFDFCVSAGTCPDVLTSFEIPAHFFTGDGRIRLQEGVGICYEKLKHLMETGNSADLLSLSSITINDLAKYRIVVAPTSRRGRALDGTKPDKDETTTPAIR